MNEDRASEPFRRGRRAASTGREQPTEQEEACHWDPPGMLGAVDLTLHSLSFL
jgi:hypothetical protein